MTLTVTAAVEALKFLVLQGAPTQSQSLQLGGASGTAWQATATTSTDGAWLTVSRGAGQLPAVLTATANPGGLTAGTYQGSITVQEPDVTPPSSTISVTVTVTGASEQSIITTVAGNGACGFSGDGEPATSASFACSYPAGVAVDIFGNLFIVDQNRIREVSGGGIITTVAGNGDPGPYGNRAFYGDGGPATSAALSGPAAVAVDTSGNLFIADTNNNRIRKVSAIGIITTVAGGGSANPGDGGPATSVSLGSPFGVAVDVRESLLHGDPQPANPQGVSRRHHYHPRGQLL
jgi:hypothetical protein